MNRLNEIWRAGLTLRWHTTPELYTSMDRCDGHSARMAKLIRVLHPDPTLGLIDAALVHDDGEISICDMRGPAKKAHPNIAAQVARVEEAHLVSMWGDTPANIGRDGLLWIRFVDKLDAEVWARLHNPIYHATEPDFAREREWMLGVVPRIVPVDKRQMVIDLIKGNTE